MTTPYEARHPGQPPRRRGARPGRPGAALAQRLPVLLLIVVLVVAAVVVQHNHGGSSSTPTAGLTTLMPTAAGPDALSSTWYCAGGTATGGKDGVAEETVQIANNGDQAVTGRITARPSQGDPVVKPLQLAAHSRTDIRLSDMVVAPYAAATVEVAGGEIAVSHLVEGPTGSATAACTSSPSDNWYLPTGTTRAGVRQLVAVYNPFPSDAVVGLTFQTDDGARTPQAYDSVVVPAGRVTVLDIGTVVTLRNDIATTVTVRSGRVVVDQIESWDGTQGTPKALDLTPAAPQGTDVWWFADGPIVTGAKTAYVVQNPGTQPVDVQLQIRLDQSDVNGTVQPYDATVPPGGAATISLDDGRVPAGLGYTAVVRSTHAEPVIVARRVLAGPSASPPGVAVTLGSPGLARQWLVPLASATNATAVTVIVTNPSATTPAKVTVASFASGTSTPLPDMTDVEVPAGGRGGFTIPTGAKAPAVAVSVTSDNLVVTETRLVFATGLGEALAVPVNGTGELATTGLPNEAPTTTVAGGGTPAPGGTTGTGDTGSSAPGTSAVTTTTVKNGP